MISSSSEGTSPVWFRREFSLSGRVRGSEPLGLRQHHKVNRHDLKETGGVLGQTWKPLVGAESWASPLVYVRVYAPVNNKPYLNKLTF